MILRTGAARRWQVSWPKTSFRWRHACPVSWGVVRNPQLGLTGFPGSGYNFKGRANPGPKLAGAAGYGGKPRRGTAPGNAGRFPHAGACFASAAGGNPTWSLESARGSGSSPEIAPVGSPPQAPSGAAGNGGRMARTHHPRTGISSYRIPPGGLCIPPLHSTVAAPQFFRGGERGFSRVGAGLVG